MEVQERHLGDADAVRLFHLLQRLDRVHGVDGVSAAQLHERRVLQLDGGLKRVEKAQAVVSLPVESVGEGVSEEGGVRGCAHSVGQWAAAATVVVTVAVVAGRTVVRPETMRIRVV